MKTIKVFGTCCTNCDKTMEIIAQTAETQGIEIHLSKVSDLAEIMAAGVMTTPAVAVNEEVVHTGSVPTEQMITTWLTM